MPASDFFQIYESSALELFEKFQQSDHLFSFLSDYLPPFVQLSRACLVNTQKEVFRHDGLLYREYTRTPLFLDADRNWPIVPVDHAFGACFFTDLLDHSALQELQNQQQRLITLFGGKQDQPGPLCLWFANELAPFIDLGDLEDRILAEEDRPDMIFVLNRGLLVSLSRETISRIFSLEQLDASHLVDQQLLENWLDITEKTQGRKYFKLGANAPYKNFFYFYVFLLDMIRNYPKNDAGLPPEMVAIWSKP